MLCRRNKLMVWVIVGVGLLLLSQKQALNL